MTAQEVIDKIQEIKADFEREKDQGLLQRDMHKAEQALAGQYACDRILRAVEGREGLNLVVSRRVGRAR